MVVLVEEQEQQLPSTQPTTHGCIICNTSIPLLENDHPKPGTSYELVFIFFFP